MTEPGDLLQALRWRCSVKRFAPNSRIPEATWRVLEESLRLTPSSFGLQPWRFLVVDDAELRKRLLAASFGQPQITEADRLVVLAVKTDLCAADVERHLAATAEICKLSADSLARSRRSMAGLLARSAQDREAWATRQLYIALGTFLTSAAMLGVDACPMEGFDSAQYDSILGLSTRGYSARVLVAAGYRSPEDTYSRLPKVRLPQDEVVEHQ